MSIRNIIEHLASVLFPLRRESAYFRDWHTKDFKNKLSSSPDYNESTIALFSYKDPIVRTLIRSLKKEKVANIRDPLAELLAEEILATYADTAISVETPTYIVPIPLHKKRLRERGFNQSAWLGKKIADNLGDSFVYAPHLLRKVRETKKQALLRRSERLKNPSGSFSAGRVPAGAHIILVDDVVTTGATVSEAKRVLRSAGAKKISVVCVAH